MQAILDNKQQIKHIEKGRYLFHESTPASDLYYIINGKVEVSKVVPDGRELTIRISSENDLVGETVLFSQNPKYMMNAKMMEDGTVACLFQRSIRRKKSPADSHLAVGMMTWLSAQNRKNQAKFRDMPPPARRKKGAFYSTLIRLSNSCGTKRRDGKVLSNLPFTTKNSPIFAAHPRSSQSNARSIKEKQCHSCP